MFSSLSARIRGLASLFWREVAKFGTVGAFAFVVDNGLWWLLYHGVLEGSATKARLISASAATLFSWVANRFWTFRRRRQNNVTRELVLFLIINGVGIVISSGFTWVAQYPMGITDAKWLGFAGIVGIGVATILRFFAYRFWVFNAALDEEPGFQDDHELLDDGTRKPAPASGVPANKPGNEAGNPRLAAEPTPPAAP
ncbi:MULTISPECIES: GtrA family protein [Arthrobacter]|uniref:GtrA family protein n=1 Tax=Arthrobacter sunyaminii TaxID=2816859 RepID=A0A975S799_9MICC|nr:MULTISPECIES: GtrA family protein [Arthrobacter]MBO0896389.1 GtrA family protein [Arthrobacter sunyaminii]MBO0908094.1 GtrA family protein [Arthrobacter sunyaminii]QWQ37114.1 GtrA family protein [Arthrobacter sunyaminii]